MTVWGNIIVSLTSKINAVYILIPIVFSDLVSTDSEIKERPINSEEGELDLKLLKRYKMLYVNNYPQISGSIL